MRKYNVKVWLINTGWTGGAFGVGKRIPLDLTRAMVKAALSGALNDVPFVRDPVFNLNSPTACPNVPSDILLPERTWKNKDNFHAAARKLARLFRKNFEQFQDQTTTAIQDAGPGIVSPE